MLVLSRRPGQKIVFPTLGVAVEVLRAAGNTVRVGIRAPRSVPVLREELAAPGADHREHHEEAAHRLRGRLNAAFMAMHLAQKQLEVGESGRAEGTIREALGLLQGVEGEIEAATRPPGPRCIHALLVEDNINESALLVGCLRMHGIDVETAGDGRAALDYLATHERPDVVLLDMHMPVHDGPSTLAEIRHDPRYRSLKVFAVSGSRAEDCGIPNGLEGVAGWFTKPLNPVNIVEALRDSVGIN